jgi:hypothetical protein
MELAPQTNAAVMPGFNSQGGWELANRIGKAFAASSLVPAQYQDNVANCIVALEMANRMGASPLMVMQNLYIVHGNPGWSSKFLIACFNQSGRFSAMRYEWAEDRNGCRAWATEKATGERLVGPQVTVQMAQAEGWSTKNGSKWKTMPELMLMYRAAAFFVRTYAPEISMGLQTTEEVEDVVDVTPMRETARKPVVVMPTAKKPAPQIDQETGEIQQPAAEQPKPRPEYPSGALATDGEKKLIINRARSAGLDILDLIDNAGLQGLAPDLSGLTKDGFLALKDSLPKAA